MALIPACGDDGNGDVDAPTEDAPQQDGATPVDASVVDAPPIQSSCTPSASKNLALEVVAEDLVDPIFVTSPPNDPRLFIVEQVGRIRIIEDGQLLDTSFLEIPNLLEVEGREQGLLGLAFHPNFAQNGRFFINYTAQDLDGGTVVAEYRVSDADPNVADPAETRLRDIDQPATNHNGGMIDFGPDGYLYIAMGDGGGKNNEHCAAQDANELLGSLLRIDVDSGDLYGIPADNPFAAGGGAPEVWAKGLRNPWRFSFDRQTGDLYIGDVGQGSWEEIDFEPAPRDDGTIRNYGWDAFEGNQCFQPGAEECDVGIESCDDIAGLTFPIHEYDQRDSDLCSVTGGYVYRGSCLTAYQGTYFFGDFCTGQVWTLTDPGDTPRVTEITGDFEPNLGGLASFGQDATGELYIVRREAGIIYRIVAEN